MGFATIEPFTVAQNLLQASRQQIHHVVWLGQAAAGQPRRDLYKRVKQRDHPLGSLLQSCQGCQGAAIIA